MKNERREWGDKNDDDEKEEEEEEEEESNGFAQHMTALTQNVETLRAEVQRLNFAITEPQNPETNPSQVRFEPFVYSRAQYCSTL